jgi:hypothetical protein
MSIWLVGSKLAPFTTAEPFDPRALTGDCLTDRRVGLRVARSDTYRAGMPTARNARALVRDVLAFSLAVGPGLGGGRAPRDALHVLDAPTDL